MMEVARDLFKVSLYLFRSAPTSRWPVSSSPHSKIVDKRWSSIMEMSCPAKPCFEEQGLDFGNLSHFKDLGVGDEVTPMGV